MQLLSSAPMSGGVLHLDDTIPGSGKVYDAILLLPHYILRLYYQIVLLQILFTLLSLMC